MELPDFPQLPQNLNRKKPTKNKVDLGDFLRAVPEGAKKTGSRIVNSFQDAGQASMRGFAGLGTAIYDVGAFGLKKVFPQDAEKIDRNRPVLKPTGTFQKELYGTDKPITTRTVGAEIGLKESGVLAPIAGTLIPASDLIPGGNITKRAAVNILKNSDKPLEIYKSLQKTMGVSKEVAAKYSPQIAKTQNAKEISKLVDTVIRESQDVAGIAKRAGRGLKKVVSKKPTPQIDLLKQEAKKYKSAEEFVGEVENTVKKVTLSPGKDRRFISELFQVGDSDIYIGYKKTGKTKTVEIPVTNKTGEQVGTTKENQNIVELKIFERTSDDENYANAFTRARGVETLEVGTDEFVGTLRTKLQDIWKQANRSSSPVEETKKYKSAKQFVNKQPAVGTRAARFTKDELDQLRLERSFLEEAVQNDPARKIVKFTSNANYSLAELQYRAKPGTRANDLDSIVNELGLGDLKEAQEAVDRYNFNRQRLAEMNTEIRNARLAMKNTPKSTVNTTKASGSSRATAKKNASLSDNQIDTIKESYKDRFAKLRAWRNVYNLTPAEVSSVIGKEDVFTMTDSEFLKKLNELEEFGQKTKEFSDALAQVKGTIYEKELKKVDNLKKALGFPNSFKKMSVDQLVYLDSVLDQYKTGDEFLTVRQLETVKNTDLAGIRTQREALEMFAKEIGKKPEDIKPIKIGSLNKFLYDTQLAEQNDFFKFMVDDYNRVSLETSAEFYKAEQKVQDLVKAARKSRKRSILQKLVPQDKLVFKYLEAEPQAKLEFEKVMTKEEIELAKFMQSDYVKMRDYLVEQGMSSRYDNENYINHMRRDFLETWKDDGIKKAIKEVLTQQDLEKQTFEILDDRTGDILPLEKFFSNTMKRSGELEPTQNVARAYLQYKRTFEQKRALDNIMPKLSIYSQALAPKETTDKGLKMDTTLRKFFNEWMNNKKGRRVSFGSFIKQGGSKDNFLRSSMALIRTIDLGFSLTLAPAAQVGEQVAVYTSSGARVMAKGWARYATPKGRQIVKNHPELIGQNPWSRITDTASPLGKKIESGTLAYLGDATYRANIVQALGSMSKEEFQKGKLSPKRLAEIKREMGRWRVVEGAQSIFESSSLGAATMMYRGWAIPGIQTIGRDIEKFTKMIKSGDGKKIVQTKEAKELGRGILVAATSYLVIKEAIQEVVDKRSSDRTFMENVVAKAYRDSLSLLSMASPEFWTNPSRLIDFYNDLGKSLVDVVQKENKLKELDDIRNQFTPMLIRQFESKEEKRKAPTGGGGQEFADLGLPDFPELPPLEGVELPAFPELPSL